MMGGGSGAFVGRQAELDSNDVQEYRPRGHSSRTVVYSTHVAIVGVGR
jgi:hypothetical protein